jgi:hypothetical protein
MLPYVAIERKRRTQGASVSFEPQSQRKLNTSICDSGLLQPLLAFDDRVGHSFACVHSDNPVNALSCIPVARFEEQRGAVKRIAHERDAYVQRLRCKLG